MRDLPDDVVRADHQVRAVVQSWRDGEPIGDPVPVESGRIDWTADANVPGRLDLTAPASHAPRTAGDPLAVYGQRLAVGQELTYAGRTYAVSLGWFLVQAWDHDPPGVDVEGLSLEQLVADARLVSPWQRPSGVTFASALDSLAGGVLPVDTSAMTDRALPAGLSEDWTEDRLGAVRALQTAWPCDLRVDDDGVLVATPERAVTDPPHVAWAHGTAGAYVTVGGAGMRDDIYNAVVARGETAKGEPVQALAYDDDAASPTHYLGPFGRRPRFYASPLITTRAQAVSAARTVLARELRRTATVRVVAPPDPRVELLDTAAVTTDRGDTFTGLVTAVSLPLTAGDGPATYTVGIGAP